MSDTLPSSIELQADSDRPPYVVVQPVYRDPVNGALYVHRDLELANEPWNDEDHVGPIAAHEVFGDVESWAKYVTTWGANEMRFLTYNTGGLKAVLDYHSSEAAGRCQWVAEHLFEHTREFAAWLEFADKPRVDQKSAVRFIEDHLPEIVEPAAADLLAMVRTLSAHSQVSGDVEYREDGTAKVNYSRNDQVQARTSAGESAVIPSSLEIAIPILKGHTTADGKPVHYQLPVRMRVASVDNGQMTLSFSLPTADAVWEEVIAERVAAAKEELGSSFDLYRARG